MVRAGAKKPTLLITRWHLILCILLCVCFCCNAFSSELKTERSKPCLQHSNPTNDGSNVPFDLECVANPVVLPPSKQYNKWQIYYYGNAGFWNKGLKCFLPTGSSGLAESDDGISWTKVPGICPGGSMLAPSDSGWDCVQTGVSDVIRMNNGETLHMYYFGADTEELAFGPGSIAGFRMRIGRARSSDNGRTWTKDEGFLFDYDESEGFFASWPRIVRSEDDSLWKMYYHSFNGEKWKVFGAESTDEGDSWIRTGLVLQGGTAEDSFEFAGIGTRAVVPWRDQKLLMVYEGVAKSGTHALGAAYCDEASTTGWTKLNGGKPILEPGKGPLGDWCSQVIGTPFVVPMPDCAGLRIYHCGKDGPSGKMSIGVVESASGDISPESWAAII